MPTASLAHLCTFLCCPFIFRFLSRPINTLLSMRSFAAEALSVISCALCGPAHEPYSQLEAVD